MNKQTSSSDNEVPSLLIGETESTTEADRAHGNDKVQSKDNEPTSEIQTTDNQLDTSLEDTSPTHADKTLPAETVAINIAETHSDINLYQPDVQDQLEFIKIINDRWEEGILIFRVL